MHHDSLFTLSLTEAPGVTIIKPVHSRLSATSAFVLLAQPGIKAALYTVYEWRGPDCIDITPAPDWLTLNHHLLN
jgi:hypothetical protein